MFHIDKIKLRKFGFETNGLVIVCLTFNLLFNLQIPQIAAEESIQESYVELIQTYEEYLKLENSLFQKLVFSLSNFQLKKGGRLKLTFEDQLGGKWVFKPREHAGYWSPPIPIYHLFTLFGLDTPKIHFITLNINGKKVTGSIQEFISNKGTLCSNTEAGVKPNVLASDALTYLLKTHVIAWLTAEYDAHASNFLITSIKNNKISRIVRVDNDDAFKFLVQDELRYDYVDPIRNIDSTYHNYYSELWKFYTSKDIFLDLESNYEFIKFITHFPDKFFIKLILPVSDAYNDKRIIDWIVDRKYNLPFDFKQFYGDLSKGRREALILSIDIDPKKMVEISNKICKKVKIRIAELKKIKMQLQQKPGKQSEIKAIISVDGFRVLRNIYKCFSYKMWQFEKFKYVWPDAENKSLVEICDEALQILANLKSSTSNKYERQAIECYMREIEKIKTEGKPTYKSDKFEEINRVVENIVVKE